MKTFICCLVVAGSSSLIPGFDRPAIAQQVQADWKVGLFDWKGSEVKPSKIGGLGQIAQDRPAGAMMVRPARIEAGIAKSANSGAVASFAEVRERAQAFVNVPFSLVPSFLDFDIESSKIGGLGGLNRSTKSSLKAASQIRESGMNGIAAQVSSKPQYK